MKHLYNIYRPNNLDEIKGQEETVSIMKGIIESGNLPHTMLFVGVRGTGKTSIGRIFSRYVNCEHPTPNGPCNKCAACREILNESSMDVLEYDGASNNKVEDIHQLMQSAKYEPVRKKKVFIIDECHALTPAAWQSILKILEEPPRNTIFILCTTEVHKVPATIVSRCRTFYFKQISVEVIKDQLMEVCQKEKIAYDQEGLSLIAKAARGSMRDALSILEQFSVSGASCERVRSVLGLTSEESLFGLLNSIIDGHADSGLSILRDTLSMGKDAKLLVKDLITALTDIVYFIQSGDYDEIHNTDSYKEAVKDIAYKVTVAGCIDMIRSFSAIYSTAAKSGDTEFLLQTNMLNLMLERSELSLLKDRVRELEETVSNIGKITVSESNPDQVTASDNLATAQPDNDTVSGVNVLKDTSDVPIPDQAVSPAEEFTPVDDGIPFGNELPDALSVGIFGPLGNAKVVGTVNLFGDNSPSSESPAVNSEAAQSKDTVPTADQNNSSEQLPDKQESSLSEEEVDFFGETDLFSSGARLFGSGL